MSRLPAETREELQRLFREGHSAADIARKTDVP